MSQLGLTIHFTTSCTQDDTRADVTLYLLINVIKQTIKITLISILTFYKIEEFQGLYLL